MKKVFAVLMALVIAFGATACATDGGAAAARIRQQADTHGGPN